MEKCKFPAFLDSYEYSKHANKLFWSIFVLKIKNMVSSVNSFDVTTTLSQK